jgi:WD40 repeat protein
MRLKQGFLFVLLQSFFVSFAQEPKLMLPIGHTNNLNTVLFSPNMKYILTTSDDKTVKIWDAFTGILLSELEGHNSAVKYAEYSTDGKRILTCSQDGNVKVWDGETMELVFEFTRSGSVAYDDKVIFTPDGKKIAAVGYGDIKIFNADNGQFIREFTAHDGFVSIIQFSPDGKKIMTGTGYNEKLKIWDTQNGNFLQSIPFDSMGFKSAGFSPDGKTIVAADFQSTNIWNIEEEANLICKLENEKEVVYTQYSQDGKKIITISKDERAKIWNAANGKLFLDLTTIEKIIRLVQFSPDGENVLVCSYDTAKIIDLETSQTVSTLAHKNWINSICFSRDGRKIATSSEDFSSKIWNAHDGKLVLDLSGHSSGVLSTVVSQDGKKLLTIDYDKNVRVIDFINGSLLFRLIGHTDFVRSASFSPDGARIVTGSDDNTVKLWNAGTGNLINTIEGHKDVVTSVRFSLDSKKIITASHDKTINIWDVSTGQLEKHIGEFNEGVSSAELSPDGRKILFTTLDNKVGIWDIADSKQILRISENLIDDIYSARFDRWGRNIIFTSGKNPIRVFDIENKKLIHNLVGHEGSVYYAEFSPGNNFIVSASSDHTARIWDSEKGETLAVMKGHRDYLNMAVFAYNGRIITSSGDQTTKIWTPSGELIYSFFIADSNNYFSQIPSGFYHTTPAAAKLLHYVTKDLKVITFEQLDIKYNRPDKVLEAIGNTDTALIKSYRKAWEKRIKKLGIDTTQFRDGYSVPEADFVNRDSIAYEQKTGTLRLHIRGTDSTYKLDRFNVWVNESPLFGQRGISIKKKNSNSIDTTLVIKLSQGENRIETSITNVNGTESYRMPLYVNYTPAVKQKEMIRFIGIGIDRFADSQHNLEYSSKDIRDLTVKLKQRYKDSIIIDTLFNEKVTTTNVKALKQKLMETSVNDKVIVSYSGHGLLSKEYDYYLSTYSVNFNKPEENGLPYDELENLLDSIPARKKLMLIDACHSGEVDKEEGIAMQKIADSLGLAAKGIIIDQPQPQQQHVGLKNSFELMQSLFVNVGKSTGATIISAAAGNQFALERGDLKNGVFTYSLLEAMNKYPSIKISELKKIVGERVEQLTGGLQKPTSRNETIAVDWGL